MKKIIASILFLCLILSGTMCYATTLHQPEIDKDLAPIIMKIVGVIQIVGTFVAVGASIYLGIRYVLSSVDEKADIKKKLIPFVIGVIIFYGATGILQLIASAATWF